jgi:hypothetical protein
MVHPAGALAPGPGVPTTGAGVVEADADGRSVGATRDGEEGAPPRFKRWCFLKT